MLIPGYIAIIFSILLLLYATYKYFVDKKLFGPITALILFLIIGYTSIIKYPFIFNTQYSINEILINKPGSLKSLSIHIVKYCEKKDADTIINNQEFLDRFSKMLETSHERYIPKRVYATKRLECKLITTNEEKQFDIVISENNFPFIELGHSGFLLGNFYSEQLSSILKEILKNN